MEDGAQIVRGAGGTNLSRKRYAESPPARGSHNEVRAQELHSINIGRGEESLVARDISMTGELKEVMSRMEQLRKMEKERN